MTNLDKLFDSIFQSTIGWDNLADIPSTKPSFPPYNIIKSDSSTASSNKYQLQVALAGYTPDDVEVEQKDQILMVRSIEKPIKLDNTHYLYQGIAQRNFSVRIRLGEHANVTSATFQHGMLLVEVEQNLPKATASKKIPINS